MKTTLIPLSRSKGVLVLLYLVPFVAGGVWMMTHDGYAADFQAMMGMPPVLTKVVGLFGVLFFGAGIVAVVTKWLDRRPGFVMTREGIDDNSSLTSVGFVPWANITGLGTHTDEIASTSTLLVYVADPEAYIRSASNGPTRFARWANYKLLGTPVTVTATTLGCSFEELFRMVSAGRGADLA